MAGVKKSLTTTNIPAMANYNQPYDEDRDYRGRHQHPSNQHRDWNNRFDEDRRGQQRWQDQDDNTRGVSGNDGYSTGSSSERRNDWDRNRPGMSNSGMSDSGLNRSGLSSNDQSWRRSQQDDDSRRYGNQSSLSNPGRSSYGSASGYGSAYYGSSRNQGSYGQQDPNRWRSNDNDADRSWSGSSAPDRSRGMNSGYGRSSDLDGSRSGGYGSSYGQQAYTSGSDPNAYGRRDQNSNWQKQPGRNRDEQDDNRWSHGRRSDDTSSNYGRPSTSGYSQGYYDADENSRYRSSRDHDYDRHDRDEHRGFFGRMADRVSDWFSDDEAHDDQNRRRDWDNRDTDRRYY
jgi:hypothetical protein